METYIGRIFLSDLGNWKIGPYFSKSSQKKINKEFFLKKNRFIFLKEYDEIQFQIKENRIINIKKEYKKGKLQNKTQLKPYLDKYIKMEGEFDRYLEGRGYNFISLKNENIEVDHNWFPETTDLKILRLSNKLEKGKIYNFEGKVEKYEEIRYSLNSFALLDSNNDKLEIISELKELFSIIRFRDSKISLFKISSAGDLNFFKVKVNGKELKSIISLDKRILKNGSVINVNLGKRLFFSKEEYKHSLFFRKFHIIPLL